MGFSLSLSADAEAEPTWEMKMVRQERLRHQRTDSLAPCTSSGSTWTVRWECVCWGRGGVGVRAWAGFSSSPLENQVTKDDRLTSLYFGCLRCNEELTPLRYCEGEMRHSLEASAPGLTDSKCSMNLGILRIHLPEVSLFGFHSLWEFTHIETRTL